MTSNGQVYGGGQQQQQQGYLGSDGYRRELEGGPLPGSRGGEPRDRASNVVDDKIKVIVRVRPILRQDKDTVATVRATADKRSIEVVQGDQLKNFAFNLCCGPDVTQVRVVHW
jgi:hypothetical protein